MSLSAPLDAMFVASETREHPMHVDDFHVFRLPDGAGPTPCRRCTGASPPGPRPFPEDRCRHGGNREVSTPVEVSFVETPHVLPCST